MEVALSYPPSGPTSIPPRRVLQQYRNRTPILGFVTELLHIRAVVDALLNRRATSDASGEKSVHEENDHRATQSELCRPSHSGSPSLGNVGERTTSSGDRSSGATDRSSNRPQSKTGDRA